MTGTPCALWLLRVVPVRMVSQVSPSRSAARVDACGVNLVVEREAARQSATGDRPSQSQLSRAFQQTTS